MQEIELPDGTIAEFPDGMSDDAIRAVLKRKFSGAGAAPPSALNGPASVSPERAARRAQMLRTEQENAAMSDPTGSMLDNIRAGMGKSFFDTGRGLKQLGLEIADWVDPPQQNVAGLVSGQKPMGRADKYQQYLDQVARRDERLSDTGGGLTGNIAGQTVQMVVPGGALGKAGLIPKAAKAAEGAGFIARTAVGARNLAPAVAGGAAFAGTQPVLSGQTRLGNMAFGGAAAGLGQKVAGAVGKYAKGWADELAPGVRELALKAQSFGIPVSRAQLSDSGFVKGLASVLKGIPGSGAGSMAEGQRRAFTRAVGRTFGADAEQLTPDVAAAAKGKLGKEFDRLTARNNLQADSQLLDDLVKVTTSAEKMATSDNARIVSNHVDELLSKTQNGVIPGRAYREFDSALGRAMKTQDGDRKFYLGQIRDAVRSAMDRSIPEADQAAWKAARGKYKNLKTVEGLLEKAPTGEINPALLLNAVRSANKDVAYGGGGDLADLARIGQQFLKDPVPNSGTPLRAAIMAMMGGGAVANPAMMLKAMATGRVANQAVNSPASGRLVLQGSAAARKALPFFNTFPYLGTAGANAMQQYGAEGGGW